MTKSYINDKLYKTFEKIKGVDEGRGVLIKQYGIPKDDFEQIYHIFHEDGKIAKRMVNKVSDNGKYKVESNYRILEFSPNDRIIADYKAPASLSPESIQGKIFDENGKVKKEIIGNTRGLHDEISYLPDGTKLIKSNGEYEFSNIYTEQLASKEFNKPKYISILNGDDEKRYLASKDSLGASIRVGLQDGELYIHKGKRYGLSINTDSVYGHINTDKNNGQFKISHNSEGITKHSLLDYIKELEDALKLIKENNMLENIDGFKKFIQELKEYADKL